MITGTVFVVLLFDVLVWLRLKKLGRIFPNSLSVTVVLKFHLFLPLFVLFLRELLVEYHVFLMSLIDAPNTIVASNALL